METRAGAPKSWLVAATVACAGAFVFWWLARGPAPLDEPGVEEAQQAARTAQPARADREGRGEAVVVAADAEAASSEPSPSEPVDDRPATVTEASERWLAFPRRKRTLARSFALVPSAQTSMVLVRHIELNPGDVELEEGRVEELSGLAEQGIAEVERSRCAHTKKRNELVRSADASGSLHELSLATVPPEQREKIVQGARLLYNADARKGGAPPLKEGEVPPARYVHSVMWGLGGELLPDGVATLSQSGKMLVLRRQQAQGLEPFEDLVRDAKRSFLQRVLAWFLREGLITPADSARIVAEFEVWAAGR